MKHDNFLLEKNKKTTNGRGRSYSPASTNSRSTIKKKAQSIQAKQRDTNLSNYKSTKGTSKFDRHNNAPSATGSCPGIH